MQYRPEHLGLAARDTVAMQQWYRRVLGARLVFDNRKTPPAFFLEMPGGFRFQTPGRQRLAAETENETVDTSAFVPHFNDSAARRSTSSKSTATRSRTRPALPPSSSGLMPV